MCTHTEENCETKLAEMMQKIKIGIEKSSKVAKKHIALNKETTVAEIKP